MLHWDPCLCSKKYIYMNKAAVHLLARRLTMVHNWLSWRSPSRCEGSPQRTTGHRRKSSSSGWGPAGFSSPGTSHPPPASSGPWQGAPEPPKTGEDGTWGINGARGTCRAKARHFGGNGVERIGKKDSTLRSPFCDTYIKDGLKCILPHRCFEIGQYE